MRRLILNIDGPSITVAHWADQTCLSSETRALNVEELSGVAQGLKRVLYRGWQRDEPNPQDQAELETLASRLGEIMLGDETRQGLDRATGDDLALVIPRAWLFVPWELAAWDRQPLLSQFGMGRQIAELQPDISSDDDQLGWRSNPTAYIWANPHFDLVAAEREAEWVHRRLSLLPGLPSRSIVTSREDLSKEALLKAFQQSDLFHFAGHARVVNQTRTWPLKDGELSAGDLLLSSGGYPSFVFANACGSADVTATESGESLVEAFLRSGVRHFLGPWTPVQDRLALSFAARFYERLAHGDSIGQAVLQTRRTLHEQSTWGSLALSSYVLYGDPRCRFRKPATGSSRKAGSPQRRLRAKSRFPVNCSVCGKTRAEPIDG
ncbi:MAG: CHAT domain-containing protein [Pirellulaceae bacterium]